MRQAWLVFGTAAAIGLVLALENSGTWSSLRGAIESLDFDASRAALIQAWIAAMVLGAAATLLSGRPWISGLVATLFTGVTYVGPFGDQLRRDVPQVFGLKETFQSAVLWHNQAAILGVSLVAALVAAATADLVRRGLVGLGLSLWRALRFRHGLGPLALAIAVPVAVGLTVVMGLVLATDIDPLLRWGPEHGVYVAPVISARPQPMPLGQAVATPEPIPAHGQVLDEHFYSQAMGELRRYYIYLPPTYGLARAANRHYPVLYLLHGDPGGVSSGVQIGATNLFDAGIAAGAMPETILVMPDGNGHVTAATQWANRFDGRDRLEDALLELVDTVDAEYRTVADRNHRVIAGFSSGGFGAANIAARHPNLFGSVIVLGGYYLATGPVFGGDPAYIRRNSPYYVVRDQPAARAVRYILVIGNQDPYYGQANAAFAAVLNQLGVAHELDVIAGGHSIDLWNQGLALGMTRVAKSLDVQDRPPVRRTTHGPQD